MKLINWRLLRGLAAVSAYAVVFGALLLFLSRQEYVNWKFSAKVFLAIIYAVFASITFVAFAQRLEPERPPANS